MLLVDIKISLGRLLAFKFRERIILLVLKGRRRFIFRRDGQALRSLRRTLAILLSLLLIQFAQAAWNNPYPRHDSGRNILYSSFSERPKHLDPIRSYSSNEYAFIGQIYEPPLQYHYLKRPYELIALTAEAIPQPHYYDEEGKEIDAAAADEVAYSVYDIRIRPGIRFQPHPAFSQDEQGQPLYLSLDESALVNIHTLSDFPVQGSRELVAEDYVYQIKRLAHPRLNSPIQGLMSEYIVGLSEYAGTLTQAWKQLSTDSAGSHFLDLRKYPLAGVEVVDRYRYRIRVKGRYPQLLYWLAMPFFAPMPWEADQFYSQAGMKERNISLDWYPVGTGAYMLTLNDPNLRMVLERNPNFHPQFYPTEGEAGDRERGWLDDAGKRLPFIDKVIYNLEKESIPIWGKFLQGYYDVSGVSSDSFDQAIQFSSLGEAGLTPLMQEKEIALLTNVQTSISYMGFNMLDPVIGGDSERARLLRRSISIAVDYEEFISIFFNGRGMPAQDLIPPGIFGHIEGEAGINSYVYDWKNGRAQRKSVAEAKALLARAGYPGGRDSRTGKPLLIHLDITGGGPEDKARFDWLRKQLKKIDLELVVRNTDYNRFQEKMRKGNAQLFMWGWNADYPDPENFLFLLYGPNGKVKHHGENAANYASEKFDRLFEKMKTMNNTPERMAIIQQMIEIVRRDSPWIWGFHPKQFVLHHRWYLNAKANLMANNALMYRRLDPALREQKRAQWNPPVVWPLALLFIALAVSVIPALVVYRRKERKAGLARSGERQ
ncbi:ABC transporter, substrate-binding protein (cluster 5, nickel/peptides/opines) [hydrothermal vent metagenome]|uniref:ABC transporter, substrate-binding protein (Cluster 5, nickel/peptides/opines) n=1 Tax=hydrothermal vent metagenome TaxID=652676 RepID=A0A3B1BHE7_9ZZZZ